MRREARAEELSISYRSARRWDRPEVMPPSEAPEATQPRLAPCGSIPGVSTSSCLTSSLVLASRQVMAAVPTMTPSTGAAAVP